MLHPLVSIFFFTKHIFNFLFSAVQVLSIDFWFGEATISRLIFIYMYLNFHEN